MMVRRMSPPTFTPGTGAAPATWIAVLAMVKTLSPMVGEGWRDPMIPMAGAKYEVWLNTSTIIHVLHVYHAWHAVHRRWPKARILLGLSYKHGLSLSPTFYISHWTLNHADKLSPNNHN